MDEINFPWEQEAPPEKNNQQNESAVKQKKWRQDKIKKILPAALLLIFIVLAAFSHAKQKLGKNLLLATAQQSYVVGLELLLPVPKGQIIIAEMTKELALSKKSLSKSQLLKLIHPEDIIKLDGKLKAKKDLPPHQPLFWGDLDFVWKKIPRKIPKIKNTKAKISYSGEPSKND